MLDLKALDNTLWLMEPGALTALAQRVTSLRDFPTAAQVAVARREAAQQMRRVAGRVGIIPVHGVVEQRMGLAGMLFGGFGTEDGEALLDSYLADKGIGAVLLHIDSPGGSSYGTPEFADAVYRARSIKPVYSLADSFCASAAFWIGSAAGTMAASPSADVGSIGVYSLHADQSKALEKDGIAVTMVRRPEAKAETNPYEPLTTAAKEHLQQAVDETYSDFLKAVARNRGVSVSEVREKYGQGRVLSARRALEAGMIDKVMTYRELMGRLAGDVGQHSARLASAELLRMRHEHAKRKLA